MSGAHMTCAVCAWCMIRSNNAEIHVKYHVFACNRPISTVRLSGRFATAAAENEVRKVLRCHVCLSVVVVFRKRYLHVSLNHQQVVSPPCWLVQQVALQLLPFTTPSEPLEYAGSSSSSSTATTSTTSAASEAPPPAAAACGSTRAGYCFECPALPSPCTHVQSTCPLSLTSSLCDLLLRWLQVKTTDAGNGKSPAEVTTEKYGLEAGLYQVQHMHRLADWQPAHLRCLHHWHLKCYSGLAAAGLRWYQVQHMHSLSLALAAAARSPLHNNTQTLGHIGCCSCLAVAEHMVQLTQQPGRCGGHSQLQHTCVSSAIYHPGVLCVVVNTLSSSCQSCTYFSIPII
jgi:hypothetical protein